MSSDAMQLFEDQPIRSAWDAVREEWYFLSWMWSPL